jgi:hypothetical protein
MSGILLAQTDTDASPLDLDDGTHFSSRWSAPGPQFAASGSGRSLGLSVRVLPSQVVNWNTLARKLLTDAPRGQGAGAVAQSNMVLILSWAGESTLTYLDVLGTDADTAFQAYRAGWSDLLVTLRVARYARGPVQAFNGLAIPAGGGQVWVGNIPGDVAGYARLKATVGSSGG